MEKIDPKEIARNAFDELEKTLKAYIVQGYREAIHAEIKVMAIEMKAEIRQKIRGAISSEGFRNQLLQEIRDQAIDQAFKF